MVSGSATNCWDLDDSQDTQDIVAPCCTMLQYSTVAPQPVQPSENLRSPTSFTILRCAALISLGSDLK